MQSIFGVFADDRSHTLWACSNGSVPSLSAFDLKSGHLKGHYPLQTPGGLCNDIATAADGTAYATDSNNMQVVRLKPHASALEVWSANGAFGGKGGVVDGIAVLGKTVYVNTLMTGKLFSVPIAADGGAGTAIEVTLSRPIESPDGMRSFGAHSILIVERPTGGRISKITLNGAEGRVTTHKEGGYPEDPDSIAVIGKTGYVLEGQFKAMRPDPNYTPTPYHATALAVGNPK